MIKGSGAKTRDPYWDVVKGSLMILVVLGHFAQVYLEKAGGGSLPALEALLCLIYFFHMPLFVFVSGMFSKNVAKRRDRAFVDLVVPFLVAQALWLVWLAAVDGPRYALSQALTPQFALWYLVALFVWRLLLPDLARVRMVLPVSAAVFFFVQLFGGIDNTLAVQRTLGFMFFFLLGYCLDAGRVLQMVRRIPLALAAAGFVATFCALYAVLVSGRILYGQVFGVLAHGTHVGESTGYVLGLAAYAVAFAAAVALSACFLRLMSSFKEARLLAKVGANTMPLYMAHGYAVHALVSLLVLAPVLPEPAILVLFFILTAVVVAGFTSSVWRAAYTKVISFVDKAIMK